VKIDRSFVMDLERSADARAVVDGVIKLAHALGKRVVAEGVETIKQRRILTEMGCDELQGYLFARPMTATALALWAERDEPHGDAPADFRASLFDPTAPLPLD
jgi:diguanylate cyclase